MTTRTFTAADWLAGALTDADLHDDETILETEIDDMPVVVAQRLTAADWRTLIVATVVILVLGVVLVWACYPDQPNEALSAMMERLSPGVIVLYVWAMTILPLVIVEWAVILLIVKLRGQL